MPEVHETIPAALQPRVDAALTWFNESPRAAGDTFKVTGILDPEATLGGSPELRLILCGGDRCEQHNFRVGGTTGAWQVSFAEATSVAPADRPQAELDPPPGARTAWLDRTLAQHAFVVLLFYRGFW
ncbi:MAG: hypothetical protein AAGI15_04195 [Pseudomonadota bacterium]